MFTTVTQPSYMRTWGHEHIWDTGNNGQAGLLAGTLLGGNIVRVRFQRTSQFDERRYALPDGEKGTLPYHSWIVAKGDEEWHTTGDDTTTRATLEPYLQGFARSNTALRLTLPLTSTERIFGMGERTGDMNKRGQAFPIWNIDPPMRHNDSTPTMYTSIPFYISFQPASGRAYGVLVDATEHIEMDMGKTSPQEASITVENDTLVVYFFTGPTPAAIMRQYTELTGHMPLPARWTLGHHQCRWSYKTEQEVLDVAAKLRERKHPNDGIWLDIDYMNGFRNFTWNAETFPHPEQMLMQLHEQHMHLVTIIDPGTKIDEQYNVYQQGMQANNFCQYENGEVFKGSVWPGPCVFPDFSQAKVREWWGSLYHTMLDQGVDGIWNDMDEPALTNFFAKQSDPEDDLHGKTMDNSVLHQSGGEDVTGPDGPLVLHKFFHNAYGMQMARSTYEGLRHLRPDTRPFVLTRSGTAGVQRYAAIWTGDNVSRWEDLSMAIRMCLNLGMSGVPFVGSDVGGFWDASDGELLVRFAQLGAFLPFCRNHNAVNNPDQEPWAFGERYENAYRKAIETRYQLLPYLYTLFQEASASGAPIMRPLYYHYPLDEQACDTETAFLVGDTLLSSPVAKAGETTRSVYLPQGPWFDYWDGTEYPGATTSAIPAPIDRWPLLIRGNSILPTGPIVQYVDQPSEEPLTFTCYMATDGLANYILYEDDGSTQAYRNGAFAQTSISCRVDRDAITVRIDEQHAGYKPRWKEYEVVVHVGGRVLRQRTQTGQGNVIIHF
ncbi:MAG: glycoside hydrolase family 31 protein [Ktedonobacteraceae bacterium]